MIARVADHCFWFGRYLERTESIARVLSVTGNLVLDAELSPLQCWWPVIIVSGEEPRFTARHGMEAAADGELVQRDLVWEDENPVSLHRSVVAARENARSIREVVSLEAWETVNALHLYMMQAQSRTDFDGNRYAFYQHVRDATQLCLGLLRSTMLHDTPLDFIWLGVLLERVGQTARLLDVHHHAVADGEDAGHDLDHPVRETALWLSLLRACSGFEPFMKLSRGSVTGRAVAAFLILEPRFPRSVRYCVRSAYDRLCEIRPPEEHALPGGRSVERLGALDAYLARKAQAGLDVHEIHELLTHVVDEVHAICSEIGRELLGYGPVVSTTPAQLNLALPAAGSAQGSSQGSTNA
jgi:uncharacterized alpha-E superfamily protein